MTRIAVPHKGSLAAAASQMLVDAGYAQRKDPTELVLVDPDNDVEFFYLRPRDIAVYVGSGTVDAGVTGRDLLLDSPGSAREDLPLGFGRSVFRFASMPGRFAQAADLGGARIATSYPTVVEQYLGEQGITAQVIRLEGAVETAIRLGVADAIADVVQTGATLRTAGLEVFGDPVLSSEAVLILPGADSGQHDPTVEVLKHRLAGVLVARRYVLVDYDVPAGLLTQACAITPGFESPTVAALQDPAWMAVRAMVARDTVHQVMDALYALGARAILVTTIHACRL